MSEDDPKEKTGPMSEPDLLALLRSYELAAMGSSVAAGATIATSVYPSNNVLPTLEVDRFNAINKYLARPQGDEIENRSQVVMPVLRDTIHWMMPQLMRMFVGCKYVCRFDAENEQDEAQAELETAYVHHVFMRENEGFMVLHDFFHDALLMRNGYVQVESQEEEYVTEEGYKGLDQIELAALLEDKDDEKLEVLSQREYLQDVHLPMPAGSLQQAPMVAVPQLILKRKCFDIRIRRSGKRRCIKVTCLPPEEMRITPRATEGVEGVVYTCHVTTGTRSDLISQGFERDLVESAQMGKPDWMEMDALARAQTVDQLSIENPSDRAMQEVEVRRAIVKVDFDGDGLAELRRVLVIGQNIAENEIIEETPYVSCEGLRMPHRHTGMNIDDLVGDLQVLSTQVWRGAIDNFRLSQNVSVAVDFRRANLADTMSTRPGRVIRGDGPPDTWLKVVEMPSDLTAQSIPALQYIDQLRSNRTGIGKGTMGLDPDELQNVTKGGQLAAMSAQTLILEHIARHLAEGVKGVFLKIHGAILRDQNKPLQFELSGKWQEIDPTTWRRRTKVSVNVGLGSGNSEERRANSMLLAQIMQAAGTAGLVGPKQVFEAARYGIEGLGITTPERYIMNPDSPEFAQHMQQMQQMQAAAPPAPQVQAAKIKAQTELIKQQAENSREQESEQKQMFEGRLQMMHEAIQAQQEQQHDAGQNASQQTHDATQGHREREIALDTNHLQLVETIIKALSPILTQQLKGSQENAGQVLAEDTEAAEQGMPQADRLADTLDKLHEAISGMGRPRKATLSDGRTISIE